MITNNGEPKPNPLGTDAHDGSFEGSNKLYAEHLVNDHGYTEAEVERYKWGMTESEWCALDSMHRKARLLDS